MLNKPPANKEDKQQAAQAMDDVRTVINTEHRLQMERMSSFGTSLPSTANCKDPSGTKDEKDEDE